MHPNPAFRKQGLARNLAFARDRGFGMLAVSTSDAPLVSHLPFLLSDDGTFADLHLVRSNPICRAAAQAVTARLAVTGPDGYVSPDWYGVSDQVPTWNYVAVHLTGTLSPMPADSLEDLLARQSAAYERRLPKTPWTMDKMTGETRATFLRMILPFRLDIADVQGTWKLNQNKPEEVRIAAAGQIAEGLGADLTTLAALMHVPPEID